MNQRYIPLTVAQRAGGVTLTAPASAEFATPGYYMLFLLNAPGRPVGREVHQPDGCGAAAGRIDREGHRAGRFRVEHVQRDLRPGQGRRRLVDDALELELHR